MNLRRTRAVARKEFRHILRDPRSLSLALAMPMMMLLLFGYALSLDVDQIPTAVVDQDRTPQSRDLLARFAASSISSWSISRSISRASSNSSCEARSCWAS